MASTRAWPWKCSPRLLALMCGVVAPLLTGARVCCAPGQSCLSLGLFLSLKGVLRVCKGFPQLRARGLVYTLMLTEISSLYK